MILRTLWKQQTKKSVAVLDTNSFYGAQSRFMLLWIVIALSFGRGVFVYIKVTVDLRNYLEKEIDLRLSDQYTVRKFIDIVWEIEKLNQQRREGDYIRIENKARILGGDQILADHGVTNGDRLVIL